MRRILIVALALGAFGFAAIVAAGVAFAAGPFDGTWSGDAIGSGPSARACSGPIKATVENGALHGEMAIGKFKPFAFGGTVGADGSFKSPAGRITGQFTSNAFTGSMTVPNGYCNPYKLTMSRG